MWRISVPRTGSSKIVHFELPASASPCGRCRRGADRSRLSKWRARPARVSLQRHAIGASQDAQRVRYDELIKRDKLNLDIFRLKDASLDDPDSLPPPDEIAAVIKVSLR
jgi:hypothetical protein